MSVPGYKRGSIFWALTLIAVGGLFLYQNFNPDLRPWHLIAKYWPVMIIFWGLSKLMDYHQATQHPETAPPPLFSGGEVLLLLLVLACGTVISRLVLHPMRDWPRSFGIDLDSDFLMNTYSYPETITVPAKAEIRLMIEDQRGDIEIHASDQPAIEAIIKREIKAANEAEAKKVNDQLKVEIVEEAGIFVVRSNRSSLPNEGRAARVDLVLRVPQATSAELQTERGDVTLDGLKGDQNVTARRGEVRISNVEGLVRVHKSGGTASLRDIKGSVEVDGRGEDIEITGVTGVATVNGEYTGNLTFSNIGQTLRFNSARTNLTAQRLAGRLSMERSSLEARGVDGPFEVSTRHKDISLAEFKHSLRIVTSGDVRLETHTPPTQSIDVEVRKGDIELALPAKSNFRIDAASRHGEVRSDFTGPNLRIVSEGESPSMTGAIGQGGPLIRLTNSYGTISLVRWGQHQAAGDEVAAPAPPEAPTAPALPKPPSPPRAPVAPKPPAPAPAEGGKSSTVRSRGHDTLFHAQVSSMIRVMTCLKDL
jgi:hypothetical protein